MLVVAQLAATLAAPKAIEYSFPRTRTPMEAALNPAWRVGNVLTQRLLGGGSSPRGVSALRVRKVRVCVCAARGLRPA